MTALSTDLRSSLADLQTRHADLITAVSGYKDGSLGRAIADVQAANQAVTARLDAEESAILGLAALKSAKPQPSLCLDFVEQKYLMGARRLEKGYGLGDLLTFTRASGGGRFNAQGVYEWLPANQPRIDYDPVTGECRGLLIEEQRTNLITQSSDITTAAWNKVGSTATGGVILSATGTDAGQVMQTQNVSAGAWYSGYFDLTAGVTSSVRVVLTFRGASDVAIETNRFDLDLATGTVSAVALISGNSHAVTTQDGGKRRARITALAPAGTVSARLQVNLNGTGGRSCSVHRAQLEAGSFPTSFIPTAGAQVTRAADTAVVNELSPWFNASEGTLMAEWAANQRPGTIAGFDAGSTANRHSIAGFNSNNRINAAITSGGTNVTTLTIGPVGGPNWSGKAAFAIKRGDLAASYNGAAPLLGTNTDIPVVTTLAIGGGSISSIYKVNGHIRSIRYFPRRLSNTELQAITS